MKRKTRIRRFLSVMLAVAMLGSSSAVTVLAETLQELPYRKNRQCRITPRRYQKKAAQRKILQSSSPRRQETVHPPGKPQTQMRE